MASAAASRVDSSSTQGIPRVITMPPERSGKLISPTVLPIAMKSCSEPSAQNVTKNASMISESDVQYVKKPLSKSASVLGTGDSAVSGRWTAAEHDAFLAGLKVYGREWKKVAKCIPTRTPAQIRSHAQKYFNKVTKEQQEFGAFEATRHLSCPAKLSLKTETPMQIGSTDRYAASSSYHEIVKTISENPASAESRVSSILQTLQKRYAELENHLRRIKSEEQPSASAASATTTLSMGPASAALKVEQQNLRKAAEARYEKKKVQQLSPKLSSSTQTAIHRCANVSLASMPSKGGFDSSEVLALSMLGGNFGRDSIENTRGDEQPPTKVRKTEH